MNRIPVFLFALGTLLAAPGCGGDKDEGPGRGSLEGARAFSVEWVGLLLPRADENAIAMTAVVLADEDFSAFCTAAPGTQVALPANSVMVSVLGAPAPGSYPVGGEEGPGFVQVSQDTGAAQVTPVAIGSTGTITFEEATTERVRGTFEVMIRDVEGDGTGDLKGSFDAAFCANRK